LRFALDRIRPGDDRQREHADGLASTCPSAWRHTSHLPAKGIGAPAAADKKSVAAIRRNGKDRHTVFHPRSSRKSLRRPNRKTQNKKGQAITPNPLFLLVEPRGIEPLAYALRTLNFQCFHVLGSVSICFCVSI
jgi:hypothetical protein